MTARIAKLEHMTMAQLREEWRRVIGREPRSNNRAWLFKRLSWAIQAREYGGLSARAQARLEELLPYAETWMPQGKRGLSELPPAPIAPLTPTPGVIITRVYKGRTLTVLVRDNGQFEFEGDLYLSLTAIAKTITGSHWNGHRFFFGAKSKRRSA